MPHLFRTLDGTLRKAGHRIPFFLADGTVVEAVWGGSARQEILDWWLRKPGHVLAQSEEVAAVAVRDDETQEIRWGEAPRGVRLFFVIKSETVSKEGVPYRMAVMVTTAATPEQTAYFRDERFALFGRLNPDGSREVVSSLPPPAPEPPLQGDLFAMEAGGGAGVSAGGSPASAGRRAFLTASSAMAVGLFLADSVKAQESAGAGAGTGPLMAYVGTYSSPLKNVLKTQVDLPPGNGKGIHLFTVDRNTGAMTPAGVVEMGTSPSCLAFNREKTVLYSANETERLGKEEAGSVSAFAVDGKDGKLTLINTVSSGGKGPAHLSVHPSGKYVLVANYFGGSVAVLPVLEGGKLGAATDVKKDEGEVGPTTSRNAPAGSFAFSGHDTPHAHMIETDPSGKWVLHVDLGLDRIYVWKLDLTTGKLSPSPGDRFATLPPGDGPRHFAFHPNGKWMYSIQEEGSNVVLFDWDAEGGRLLARHPVSSLPQGYEGSNFCSEIMVSGDGKFVYAGNRLHDSIGIFAVSPQDGTLNWVADEWTRGNYPRSFTFAPGGRFLYCCNQRADHVTCFEVHPERGELKFTGQFTGVGNPSIVVFRELRDGK